MKREFCILALSLYMVTGCKTISETKATVGPTEAVQVTSSHHELRIHKYPDNYTCFKLETSTGVIIITDPYAMDEGVQADIVTISHDHADHADFSRITGKYDLIDKAGSFNEKGIQITGVTGYHNKGDTGTKNIIYIFDIDGIRLAQFASQGEVPTEEMFTRIGNVDILIIQIYGTKNGKLSAQEAGSIAQRLQAKIVIPAHTDTSQTDVLASFLGVPSEKIATGELIVTKADLEQMTPKVLTLDVQPK